MIILYNIIFIILAIVYLPVFLLRGKFHKDIWMRFAVYPKRLIDKIKGKNIIWIHAVSVGEINAIRPLVERLKDSYPDYTLVLSTVTKTGNDQAKKIATENETVIYLPLDLSFIVKKTLAIINPRVLILTETEIWPNLIIQTAKRNIPVLLINGRISDKSFPKYMFARKLLRSALSNISAFAMQSEKDAQRIRQIGAVVDRVHITGNLKFDIKLDSAKINEKAEQIRQRLALQSDETVFVAGSTHPGEEEQILWVYRELIKYHPRTNLVIAPRHVQRAPDLTKLVEDFGYKARLFSKAIQGQKVSSVTIVDTIGDLVSFYSLAGLVFVGGSLVKRGGHNIIEPALFSKPVIFGLHVFNFKDISKAFMDKDAVIQVRDKESLLDTARELLENPERAKKLGKDAEKVVLENKGALDRTLQLLRRFI